MLTPTTSQFFSEGVSFYSTTEMFQHVKLISPEVASRCTYTELSIRLQRILHCRIKCHYLLCDICSLLPMPAIRLGNTTKHPAYREEQF